MDKLTCPRCGNEIKEGEQKHYECAFCGCVTHKDCANITWKEGKHTFYEVSRQDFANDKYFSAGHVEGHEVDDIYLEIGPYKNRGLVIMRKDEALAIIFALSSAVMTQLWEDLPETELDLSTTK